MKNGKKISKFQIFKLTTLSIIGSGVLFSTGQIALGLRSSSASLVIWFLACLIALVQALCYAELANIHPNGYGDAGYLAKAFEKFAFSRYIGLVYNHFSLYGVLPASAAIGILEIARLFPKSIFTCLLVTSLSLVPHLMPRKITHYFSNLIFYSRLVCLAVLGLIITFSPKIKDNFLESNWGKWPSLSTFIFSLISTTFYFSGYNTCNYMLGELLPSLKEPYFFSVVFSLLVYLFFSIGTMRLLTHSQLCNSSYINDILKDQFPEHRNLVSALSTIITAIIYIGPVFSCHSVSECIISDLKKQMKLNIPTRVLLIVPYGLTVAIYALTNSADSLLSAISLLMTFFYCLTLFSLFMLRRKRPSRIIFPVIVPIVAFSVSFGILSLDLWVLLKTVFS